jgi:nitronate monooxygenase
MWPRTELMELLGITRPIVQAPMAGFATQALAAAVSNAGGLGSLGCVNTPAEQIRQQVTQLRQATNQPFNLNFFVHEEPQADPAKAAAMRTALAPYYAAHAIGPVPQPTVPFGGFSRADLDLVLELRPRVVSFHFGLPAADWVVALKAAGCRVLSSATTVAEAKSLEAAGADAIIAQGYEAGGHRGNFSDNPGAGLVGTLALVPQIVDAVRVPVIAAGGIADGRGIAAAFMLGAGGVQIGTAFLVCPEAATPPPHRARLKAARDDGTAVTRIFTGRPARALRNRLVEEVDDSSALAFPVQSSLTSPLRQIADPAAREEFQPFWAGQAAPLARPMPASALLETLVREAQALLPRTL